MTRSTGQRRPHFKDTKPSDSAVKRLGAWLPENRTFYKRFRHWLRDGGYGDSALHTYGCAARLALGWLDKPYWEVDLQADLDRVRDYISARYQGTSTPREYNKGLRKLAEYLSVVCHKTPPGRPIRWQAYVGFLPAWLDDEVRAYVTRRRRDWPPQMQHRSTITCLSQLTRSLRHMVAHTPLPDAKAITPALWFDYVDDCLANGLSPITINIRQYILQDFLSFLSEQGRPICQHTLRVPPLDRGDHLPRDIPPDQVRRLWQEIEADAASTHANTRRMGVMDRAWFLLMLYSGLRAGEIRHLRHGDLDLDERRVRIEQSKGLKDRVVLLAGVTVDALCAYLEVRGQATTDHVFIYRHRPLSSSYCRKRLETFGRRCGVPVKPHQLRHSCATLLLNAGAPILAIQKLLGHKDIDTTLIYTRLYDSTVAADYYRAIGEVESRSGLSQDMPGQPSGIGELLALVDALHVGTLDDAQREILQALRMAILAFRANSALDDAGSSSSAQVV